MKKKKNEKKWPYHILARVQGNWKPVGMQNSEATLENGLAVSYETKYTNN